MIHLLDWLFRIHLVGCAYFCSFDLLVLGIAEGGFLLLLVILIIDSLECFVQLFQVGLLCFEADQERNDNPLKLDHPYVRPLVLEQVASVRSGCYSFREAHADEYFGDSAFSFHFFLDTAEVWIACGHGFKEFLSCVCLEGLMSQQQFACDDTEGPDVDSIVVFLSLNELGSHVARCTDLLNRLLACLSSYHALVFLDELYDSVSGQLEL